MFLGRVLGITTSVMPLACPIGLSFSSLLADGIGGKCLGQYQQRIDLCTKSDIIMYEIRHIKKEDEHFALFRNGTIHLFIRGD